MNKFDSFVNLKTNGLKSTKHRVDILDILEKSNQPMAADELFEKMREKDISINLSTVYRTLDTLSDKNLLIKLNIDSDNRTLFEFNRMLHTHHLVCLGCKKIISIVSCPLEGYEETLSKETDFVIVGHKLDIYGYCPTCRKNGLAEETAHEESVN